MGSPDPAVGVPTNGMRISFKGWRWGHRQRVIFRLKGWNNRVIRYSIFLLLSGAATHNPLLSTWKEKFPPDLSGRTRPGARGTWKVGIIRATSFCHLHSNLSGLRPPSCFDTKGLGNPLKRKILQRLLGFFLPEKKEVFPALPFNY